MKLYIKAVFLLTIVFSLTACENVIDLELTTAPPRLVVEGNLDFSALNPDAPLEIKLSLTTNYYDKEIPKVHDAKVWVEDQEGTKYPFYEHNDSGTYTSTTVKKDFINNEYKLYIEYANDVYEAKDILLPTPEVLDFVQTREAIFGENSYVLRMYFQDVVRTGFPLNYYYMNVQRNDEKPDLKLQSNEFSQGNMLQAIFIDTDYEVGDEIKIEFHQISRNNHDYLNLIKNAINNGGGPFQTPISKIKGNVKNITTPEKEALGFFRVTEKRVLVHQIAEQAIE